MIEQDSKIYQSNTEKELEEWHGYLVGSKQEVARIYTELGKPLVLDKFIRITRDSLKINSS